jgi:hypothetical protein
MPDSSGISETCTIHNLILLLPKIECPNGEIFYSLKKAKAVVEQ